jgi:hypothetical protein
MGRVDTKGNATKLFKSSPVFLVLVETAAAMSARNVPSQSA